MNVLMPQLGETVEEGTVTVWLKKIGDHVTREDLLFEVETDKVTMEIQAPAEGVLSEILVQAGDSVPVGTIIARIRSGNEQEFEATGPREAATADAIGESVRQDRDAGPAATTAPAPGKRDSHGLPLSPVVRRLLREHNLAPDEIQGTGRNSRVTRSDALAAIEQRRPPKTPATRKSDAGIMRRLSPVARKLVLESSVDVEELTEISHGGEITREAVLGYLRRRADAKKAREDLAQKAPGPSPVPGDERREVIPFDRMRKIIAENMTSSKATSAHVFQAIEVSFVGVEATRRHFGPDWKVHEGGSLTFLPFIARAVCMAIAEFPRVNASIEADTLVVHRDIHLGIAVDLDHNGLVVPVIREAQCKGVRELARETRDFARRARQRQLSADELRHGTYTISNPGSFGTLITTPIINQPQIAILTVDGIRKRPVVLDGPGGDSIAIQPIGIIGQSFDHRAIDGAYSAAFLRCLKGHLERHDWNSEFV